MGLVNCLISYSMSYSTALVCNRFAVQTNLLSLVFLILLIFKRNLHIPMQEKVFWLSNSENSYILFLVLFYYPFFDVGNNKTNHTTNINVSKHAGLKYCSRCFDFVKSCGAIILVLSALNKVNTFLLLNKAW